MSFRRHHLTAGLLAGLLSLGAVACEGGTATDDGFEPGDPGAELPADTGEGDL